MGSTPGTDTPSTVTVPGINSKPFGIKSLKNTLVKGLSQVLSNVTVYVIISPTLAVSVLLVFIGVKVGTAISLKETSSIA